MKCDFCEAKATVFLTQLVEGQMKKVCLCDSCAKERGVTDPTGFSLAEMLLSGVPGGPGTAPAGQHHSSVGGGKTCPECGFTLDDLRRVRRFGCAECYRVFHDEISPMLRGMHKGVSHVGKVPEGLMAVQFRKQRLDELRSRLDEAISSESYEEAAGIRDEIRTLEMAAQ
ncbi:UvrB/UvrC motif-containing protein [Luteolibacter pohnpeiensis]|uniref:UvrB/UvrC motif-containing protein n=1 Tax=Luteolibacter pohnpeiensis TaxID=454153 RepID=A0A934SAN2_9BACT|nr:UvrB/UvrC motif-containing protein [Luteolibacter pohnpeiensis]MBK1884490.1 UvrB/UvrC motif-containing protein [Luteolibacter pohnpeiensis]